MTPHALLALALSALGAACSDGASIAVDSGVDDVGPIEGTTDAAIDAPACAQLPSGTLARVAAPMLRNGPETYDNAKTGPRVVLKFGTADYRM